MSGSNFMHWWINLVGSFATIALVLTAFGLMLQIMRPADALKRIGAILGTVITLIFAPCILVNDWLGMTLWEKIGLVAIGVVVWQWRKARRITRRSREG
jgi:hypothetical protein